MEKFTKLEADLIEKALQHFYPNANTTVDRPAGEGSLTVNCVRTTVQGPLDGATLDGLLQTVAPAHRQYSIYRSGTGLSIKFI